MDLPVAGGFGVVAIVIAYRLLTERAEIRDLRKDFAELRLDFAKLETRYAYQRHRSHLYREVITKMVGSVDLAAMLASQAVQVMGRCDCPDTNAISQSLAPIAEILEKLHAESDEILASTQKEPEP